MEFGQLIPGLQAGRYDVVTAGMYITPERCKQVIFAEPEYSVQAKNWRSLRQSVEPPQLRRCRGSQPGSEDRGHDSAIEINYLRAIGVDESQILQYPDQASVINAVQAGYADAATMTTMSLREILASLGQ